MSSTLLRCLACGLALLGCGDGGQATGAGAGDGGGPDAGRDYEPEPFEPTEATRAYCPREDVDAIEERITGILRELSIGEKVRLMHGERLALVGGVWSVQGNERVGLPGLGMLDGPRGLSAFSGKNGTAFPVAMLRGATFDPELEERVGAAMGRELRSAGADVLLAPTVNILRHPRWGRAQETYSEDTHHMGTMGVAFIRGVQSEGVLASVKHYAVNSIEDTRHEVDVTLEERALREVYLPHFRRAVQEGRVASVMSAYNSVGGAWADQNDHLLRGILKGEWQFQGFVESDWILGTHGAAESVRAGLDIEMPAADHFRRLARQVEAGELEERFLDDAVRRIARAQLCYGLDGARTDHPGARETEAHLALAREVARRGIVLLRNERVGPAPVLPLDTAGTYVVAGPLADAENIGDEGSSAVSPTEVVTALEGLSARATVTSVTDLDAGARDAASAADAVIVVAGLRAEDEGEATVGAGDRDDLGLAADQVALIEELAELNDRLVVVIEGGAAILVEAFVDAVAGLVWAGYPGSRGGEALADVLFGDHAPAGRLPFSWPRAEADLPPFDNAGDSVTYGYLHGYRHLLSEGAEPRYPFGFGLSYTTFAFDAIRVDRAELAEGETLTVEVDVTNTGDVAASTLVPVYVTVEGSGVTRAPADLRGFTRLELAAGAGGTATIPIAARDLAYYDEEAGRWALEPAAYRIRSGPHAHDLPLQATVRVR